MTKATPKTNRKLKILVRKKPLKEYPPLIRQLIKKYDGNLLAASRAVGRANAFWLSRMATYPDKFDEAAQTIVKNAIAGETLIVQRKTNSSTRTAIIIVKGPQFEKLYDVAQVMGGEWAYKRKAGLDWIGVLKISGNDLDAFLALAKSKGAESYIT